MIFVSIAMMPEARPIIDRFNLKMSKGENRFRIYENESIKLIVTGVGATNAMIATVYLLTRYGAKKTDCLINLGIAAIYIPESMQTGVCEAQTGKTASAGVTKAETETKLKEDAIKIQIEAPVKPTSEADALNDIITMNSKMESEIGNIFLASSIENSILKRSFYPDMLLATPFAQAKVITVGEVYFTGKSIENIYNTENKSETDKEKTKRDIKSDITSDINKNCNIGIRNNLNIVNGDKTGLIEAENETLSSRSHHNNKYFNEYTSSPILVEMEAAFVYEAATGFIFSHNIFVLKIVSDSGDPESLLPVKVTSLIDQNMDKIETFITLLSEWASENMKHEIITESDRKVVEDISNLLKLTQYQRTEFFHLSEMYVIRGKSLKAVLNDFCEISPVKLKREGKESYDKIRKILLQP